MTFTVSCTSSVQVVGIIRLAVLTRNIAKSEYNKFTLNAEPVFEVKDYRHGDAENYQSDRRHKSCQVIVDRENRRICGDSGNCENPSERITQHAGRFGLVEQFGKNNLVPAEGATEFGNCDITGNADFHNECKPGGAPEVSENRGKRYQIQKEIAV